MKTNWAIRTADSEFSVYKETLKALGYELHRDTKQCDSLGGQKYLGIADHWMTNSVQRSSDSHHRTSKIFQNIEDFLKFHFSKEQSPQEKELAVLNQKMVELQAQINVLSDTIINQ